MQVKYRFLPQGDRIWKPLTFRHVLKMFTVFLLFISVCRLVALWKAILCPKTCTLFCLVRICFKRSLIVCFGVCFIFWMLAVISAISCVLISIKKGAKGNAYQQLRQKTQEVKNERFTQCANFRHTLPLTATNGQTNIQLQTRSLRGMKRFNCHLQQWHSAKCLLLFVFDICLSVCRSVKGNVCRKCGHSFASSEY